MDSLIFADKLEKIITVLHWCC